jgi:hypothetical protein
MTPIECPFLNPCARSCKRNNAGFCFVRQFPARFPRKKDLLVNASRMVAIGHFFLKLRKAGILTGTSHSGPAGPDSRHPWRSPLTRPSCGAPFGPASPFASASCLLSGPASLEGGIGVYVHGSSWWLSDPSPPGRLQVQDAPANSEAGPKGERHGWCELSGAQRRMRERGSGTPTYFPHPPGG